MVRRNSTALNFRARVVYVFFAVFVSLVGQMCMNTGGDRPQMKNMDVSEHGF